MSDPSKRIHFGSLESVATKDAKEGEAKKADAGSSGSAAVQAAVRAGNINIHNESHTEVLQLSEESREAQEKHAELLKKVEVQHRARLLVVPTKPEEVRKMLRENGQPVRLFGEGVADVRERLRAHLAAKQVEGEEAQQIEGLVGAEGPPRAGAAAAPGLVPRGVSLRGGEQQADASHKKSTVVYTPASEELMKAREHIGTFSLARARERLAGAKRRREEASAEASEALAREQRAAGLCEAAKRMTISSSQFADDRPLSSVKASPDGDKVATGSWAGLLKLWDSQTLEMIRQIQGHRERVTGVDWHPQAFLSKGEAPLFASGSADRTAKLWDARTGDCVGTLEGHQDRLARLSFHPSGAYLGTASFDYTWRLWDVETGAELLLQDGHHKQVYSISFQCDGAVVATGDLAGEGRLWDLRSGKCIGNMSGHVKSITCSDFSPSGYELATGSDDHTVRVWDLRKQKWVYCLPAHSALISDVRFGRSTGETLTSASFDTTAKVWSTRDWSLLRVLSGHEGKVSACDVTPDELKVVTCSHDRTLKVWAQRDGF